MRPPHLPGWLQGVLLAAVVFAVLSPAVTMGFIWDDFSQIVDSETIRDLGRLPQFFTRNVRQGAGVEGGYGAENLDTYRPLFLTALAVHHALAGGPRPGVFHVFSVAWHVLATVLCWLVARRWLGRDRLALLVAVLFAFNPVTAEAHLFVSAVCDPIAASSLLGAILLLEAAGGRGEARAWLAASAAGLLLLAGLLTKEVIVMALPAVSVWLVVARGVRARLLLPAWGAVGFVIALRTVVLRGLEATGPDAAHRLDAVHHAPLLILDGLRAVLGMTPVGYRDVSYEYELLPWTVSVAATALLALLVWLAWRSRHRAPLLIVALAVHVSMLLPVALLSSVHDWGGFGRYMYLPWAFLSIAIVQALPWVSQRIESRRAARAAAIAALVVYLALQQLGLRAARDAYRSDEDLARGAVAAAPYAPTGYLLLGQQAVNRGDLQGSLAQYQEAFSRNPDIEHREACQNYAIAMIHTGRPAEALALLEQMEQRGGRGPKSSYAVALALHALGRDEESLARLDWALERAPDDADLAWLRARVAGGGGAAGVSPGER